MTTTTNESDPDDSKKSARRRQRKELLEQLPKTDEHGIAYTKQQLRRMRKRLERGLNPIETEAEQQERLQREKELQKEEALEFAGMVDERETDVATSATTTRAAAPDKEQDDDPEPSSAPNTTKKRQNQSTNPPRNDPTPRPRKKPRTKEVPADYVCQACQNRHTPPNHWIYDCPDKEHRPGTNQPKKGSKRPDPRKVFVSGLPFDTKHKDLQALFGSCGKLVFGKLLTFEDSERCKGQAFLTFDTREAAQKALGMNGQSVEGASRSLKLQISPLRPQKS